MNMNMDMYEHYLARELYKVAKMKDFDSVEWSYTEYGWVWENGDESDVFWQEISFFGKLPHDADDTWSCVQLRLHNPVRFKERYELDCIVLSCVLQRIFEENDIHCPYMYPVTLKTVSGLMDDAAELLRLKEKGELDRFEFRHCLADVNHVEMVDIVTEVYNNSFGCNDEENGWRNLMHYITHNL